LLLWKARLGFRFRAFLAVLAGALKQVRIDQERDPRAAEDPAQDPRERAFREATTTAVSLTSRVKAWPVRDEP